MKKLILFALSIVLLTSTLFWAACSKPDDEGWTDDEKASYEEVLSLQDEVSNNLDEWFLSMDSLDAINEAYQSFSNSEFVSLATINSQGIAVQYENGMRGGIFLNSEDENLEKSSNSFFNSLQAANNRNLESIVNKKKMILINPHYYQRSYYADLIYSYSRNNLQRAGIDLSTFYKNEQATVDRFTELSGYGIIQIYSHGFAWPKKENITDIYLLTGELANEATSKKYWNELKTGNIPVIRVSGISNKYCVSQKFVSDYNDFSQDTVLFFGGFCYSFLGDWPDIIESFADGAYLGFDWSVLTSFNANMSVNSMALMSDTSKMEPMNLEEWMNDGSVDKSYNEGGRTISIHYTGDGNLILWDDVEVRLIPLSSDGAPVSIAGEANVAYPFRCETTTNVSPLEYVWDIGDGGPTTTTQSNEVEITWFEDGVYELSVDVNNKNNGELIGSASLNVTIGEDLGIVEFVTSCRQAVLELYPGDVINGLNGSTFEHLIWQLDDVEWSGLNFSGTTTDGNFTNTINGTITNDGQKVGFTAEQVFKSTPPYTYEHKLVLTIANYPFSIIAYGYADYYAEFPNQQNYIENLGGFITYSSGETHTLSIADLDQNRIGLLLMRFITDK